MMSAPFSVPWGAKQLAAIGALVLVCCASLIVGPRFGSPNDIVMTAIFVTSVMSSIVGFSFLAIGGAALAIVAKDPSHTSHVMALCGLGNQIFMTWSMRGLIEWPILKIYLIGGALGLPVGLAIWSHAGFHVNAHPFGAAMIAMGLALPLARRFIKPPRHRWFDLASGFIGGATGGAFMFPGAPVAVWRNVQDVSRTRQRAVFQPFMLIFLLPGLIATSILNPGDAVYRSFADGDLFCMPVGLLGTAIGIALFRAMSDQQFSTAVSLQLMMSGLGFLII